MTTTVADLTHSEFRAAVRELLPSMTTIVTTSDHECPGRRVMSVWTVGVFAVDDPTSELCARFRSESSASEVVEQIRSFLDDTLDSLGQCLWDWRNDNGYCTECGQKLSEGPYGGFSSCGDCHGGDDDGEPSITFEERCRENEREDRQWGAR